MYITALSILEWASSWPVIFKLGLHGMDYDRRIMLHAKYQSYWQLIVLQSLASNINHSLCYKQQCCFISVHLQSKLKHETN